MAKIKRNPFRPGCPEEECNPRWDFWEEGISSSLLANFMTCREQMRMATIEGWTSYYTPLSLSFGTCMHWCLEHAYANRKAPSARTCKRLVANFEKLWLKEKPNAPTKQLEVQDKVYGLAESVLPAYFKRWAGDFPGKRYPKGHNTLKIKGWEGLEQQFSVPFTYEDGETVPIRGTRDGLPFDEKDGLWVFDSKCYSVINVDQIAEQLPLNFQQMLYIWATWRETGIAPKGAVMNIIRRPGHRLGGSETKREFYSRIRKDVEDPKRWDHFFIRVQMRITLSEIKEWYSRQLEPLMYDVRNWYDGYTPHYMNPNNLVTKYGLAQLYGPIVRNDHMGCYQKPVGTVMSYQTDIA